MKGMNILALSTNLEDIIHQLLIVFLVIFFWIYFFIFWIGFLEHKWDFFFPTRIQVASRYHVPTFIQVYLPEKQTISDSYNLARALEAEAHGFSLENKWKKDYQDILNEGQALPETMKKPVSSGVTFMETPVFNSSCACNFYPTNFFLPRPIPYDPTTNPFYRPNAFSTPSSYGLNRPDDYPGPGPSPITSSDQSRNHEVIKSRDGYYPSLQSQISYDSVLPIPPMSFGSPRGFVGLSGEVSDDSLLYKSPSMNYSYYSRNGPKANELSNTNVL